MTATSPAARHVRRAWTLALALSAIASAGGCAPGARDQYPFTVREITPPFLLAREARDPSIAADARGTVALAWVVRDSGAEAVWLSVSRDSGTTFSAPARVSLDGSRVVSFPECRPAVALGPGGSLAVAWSQRRTDSTGAVDLCVRASADFGRTLGGVAAINDDVAGPPPGLTWRQLRDWPLTHRADAFHGYPALAFTADGSLLAAWLDDRRTPAPVPARLATLWRSISTDGGQTWGANLAVTDSACPCCRPALATAADGAVALAYRDASNDLRDPRLAQSFDGGRAFPADTLVSRDGWKLSRCPDQGPAFVWDHPHGGHYVWFTGARPAGVYVVRWRSGGGAAGVRRPVPDSLVAAHPVAAAFGDDVLIGVESHAAEDTSQRSFAVRTLDPAGAWSPWTFLGANATSGGLVTAGARRAVACWVEHEPGRARLRLATLTRRKGTRA